MRLQAESDNQSEQQLRNTIKQIILGTSVPTRLRTSAKNVHKSLRYSINPIRKVPHSDYRILAYYIALPQTWLDKLLRVRYYEVRRVSNAFMGTWDSSIIDTSNTAAFVSDYSGAVIGRTMAIESKPLSAITGWKV